MSKSLRLPIQNPCHENWDAMARLPGSRRFCDSCSKQVHDLSELSETEARELLASPRGERLCIRYLADPSGSPRFRVPSVPASPPPRWAGWRASLAAGAAVTMSLVACTDASRAPARVDAERCHYLLFPAGGYTLARGEGNCPPAEVDASAFEDAQVMGKIRIPAEDPQILGELIGAEPPPEIGQAPAEPTEAESMVRMGDFAG